MVPDRVKSFIRTKGGRLLPTVGVRRGGLLLVLSVVPALCWVLVIASCSVLGNHTAENSRKMFRNEPDIRVRVKKTAEVAEVGGDSGVTNLIIRPIGYGSAEVVPGPLAVKASGGGLSITARGQAAREIGPGIDVEVMPSTDGQPEAGARLKVDGIIYPGLITLRARSDESADRFDVVATMKIEEYLPGVVVKEMYQKWPEEAFKVQAVCSRSYALHERERARASGKPFDVESSTLDQVYGGATANMAATRAVEDTRGMVLTYSGKLLRAYYSSTCGGRAASAADVFPTTAGYEFNLAAPLQAKARETYCEKSPWYRWDVVRPTDELSQRIKAWGKFAGRGVKNMSRVAGVEVATANVAERPARYVITDNQGGTFNLNSEELRVACNYTAEGQESIKKETRVNSGDLVAEVKGASVRLRGRGFGHGVGMCQWCVKGMVERDKEWKAILADFYPGSQLQSAY